MRTFKDTAGHSWEVKLTVGKLLAVKQNMGVNLLDHPDQIPDDIPTLMDLLWFTCIDEAKALGLSDIQFGERLDGGALADAVDAWMEEWADFFTRLAPAKKELIAGVWEGSKRGQEVQAERIRKAFSSLSFDSLGSSESIPPS